MADSKGTRREQRLAEIMRRAGLPNAPLAMPKQALEFQHNWLFAIYARVVGRPQP